jgi:hypothetical protein
MLKNKYSQKLIFAAAMLMFLVLPAQAFCQSTEGSITGIVRDPSNAVVKGAIVSMKNMGTDIEIIRSTDASGRYSFLGLEPGSYTMTVETEKFEKWTMRKVVISAARQLVQDVQLNIGIIDGGEGRIDYFPDKQDIITKPDSSLIQTISPEYLQDLPILTNNAIDFLDRMGGVVLPPGNKASLDQSGEMVFGESADSVQVVWNGLYTNEPRWNTGASGISHINTNIVDKFEVVISPVDPEFRGGKQVIILTKQGTNQFRGGINYNGSGSFLTSGFGRRNFLNNWNNQHNYSASFSGPIIKRKLFFFVNWDRVISRQRQDVAPVVLTPCARKGIYRYFSGFENGNASNSQAGFFGSATTVNTVHENGTPYYDNPALNGAGLQLQSVFGQLDPETRALLEQDPVNCSTYDPYTNLGISTYWETGTSTPGLRQLDMVTVPRFSSMMPLPNNYGLEAAQFGGWAMYDSAANAGDGLNTAVHKWTRVTAGTGSVYASLYGRNPQRKTLNANTNWNINDRHRMSMNYMIELQGGINASRNWDGSPDPNFTTAEGQGIRRPQQIGINLMSTFKANMLNELRAGLSRTVAHQYSPMDDPVAGPRVRNMLEYLVPTDNFPYYQGFPLLVGLGPEAPADTFTRYMGGTATPSSFTFSPQGNGAYNFSMGSSAASGSHPYGTVSNGLLPTFGGTDHRWTITDSFTWLHGAHTFKFGGDIRLTRSFQESEGMLTPTMGSRTYNALTFPVAFGGFTSYSLPNWEYPEDIGLVGTQMAFNQQPGGGIVNTSSGTYAGMLDLLTYMSGSLSEIRQQYFVNDPFQRTWNDIVHKGELFQIVDMRQKEMAFFAKDDWRVSPILTVNLGVRWEFLGVPWLANGMTVGLQGGGLSMFGVTGRSIHDWMPEIPVQLDDTYLTKQIFIGPNSPNPDAVLYNQDYSNFGPAVGFSWQLPWLGRNRTVLRGGYQLSYRAIGNASNRGFGAALANEPGTIYNHFYRGSSSDTYLSTANLADHVPASRFLDPSIVPLDVLKITDHSQNYTGYDPNIRTPYTHNINLSLTHVINNITIDLRYVSTLSRKGVGDININTPNVFRNKELLEALNAVRRGEESPLIDRMLNGFVFGQTGNWNAVGSEGGPTGAYVLKNFGTFQSNLANGNYAAVATALANLNYDKEVTSLADNTVRLINQDYPDIPAGVQGAVLRANGFPENYILGNPQMAKADYRSNLIRSNYHSFQAQVQLRPTRGLRLTSTYTFAKQLAHQPGGNMYRFYGGNDAWTDPLNMALDYKLLSYGQKHQWNNYGIMEIPIGRTGYFLHGLENGMLRRLLEGWQFSWTMQMASGSPSQVTGNTNHFYNNATLMNLVPIMDPTLNPAQDPKYGMELAQKLAPNKGNLEWPAGSQQGYFYPGGETPNRYIIGADPQCSGVAEGLNCTLQALYLALPDGNGGALGYAGNEAQYASRVILQNPLPGNQGNFSRYIEGLGSFSLDMGMIKNLMITEGKSIQIRMQASNVLNHPSPCGYAYGGGMNNCPSLAIGNTDFGVVNRGLSWGQNRQFQGNFRLLF